MQMERERRNNGDYYHQQLDRSSLLMEQSPPSKFSPHLPSISSPASSSSSSPFPAGYIEHPVSKFDTLAGVAIKYGVEVADIKRMNGLVTDLQMFALKTLHIPLPGRHPPSPVLANGFDTQGQSSSEQTTPSRRHSDLFDSFQSLKLKSSPQRPVSSAMSSLQGYYGLKANDQKAVGEGFEMVIYHNGGAHYLEDAPPSKRLPLSNPPLGLHRKSKSLANGLSEKGEVDNNVLFAEGREGESDKWFEKLVRRRQKSDAESSPRTPEMLLKEDSSSICSGGFSAAAGKGLALRPKAASRTSSTTDAEPGRQNPSPIGLGDSVVSDSFGGVRKSSSTSSLQESDSSSSSSIWPTSKWSLKPDLQALSTAAITRPIFDGLPKPITGRRNKAALD